MIRKYAIISLLTALATFPALAEPACGLYQYRADVYDGDTITADIDLGFNTWRRGEKLRLYGLDTPEVRGPDKALGIAARDALRNRIMGKQVTICTIKDENSTEEEREKFGRYLAKVYIGDELVNDWMIEQGFGRAYSGDARQLFSAPAGQ
jgi:micrococcal nuclease